MENIWILIKWRSFLFDDNILKRLMEVYSMISLFDRFYLQNGRAGNEENCWAKKERENGRKTCQVSYYSCTCIVNLFLHVLHVHQTSQSVKAKHKKGSYRIQIHCYQQSVLSFHLSVNFSHFHLLLKNNWANFNKTWHKASLGEGDSSFFKWRVMSNEGSKG